MTSTISGFKAFSNKANTPLANVQANETTKPDQTPPTNTPSDKPTQGDSKPK